jgi:hypothetical protein
MNMYQIIAIYLKENKSCGEKNVVMVEPGTGSSTVQMGK